MQIVPAKLDFATADGDRIALRYDDGELLLSFREWGEDDRRIEVVLHDTLAFRWQEQDAPDVPRDDQSFEVLDSPWLAAQARVQAVIAAEYRHYMLCFNAAGVLDVLCRGHETRRL